MNTDRTRSALGPVLVALVLLAAACGGNGTDRRSSAEQAAIDQAVAALVDSGVGESAAACYVGGLVDTFGLDAIVAIGAGGSVSDEVSTGAADLIVECGVFTDLSNTTVPGDQTGPTTGDYRDLASPREQVDGPYAYGDDATLDALWDQCAAGSGEACDSLFFDSPVGSIYEAFGNTCGNRPEANYDCSTLEG